MKIETETRFVNISLRLWDGGYDPDCFSDLETTFPQDHPQRVEEWDGTPHIFAPDSAVDDLISWWTATVAAANAGTAREDDDCYLTPEARENGQEWALFAEEAAK